MPCSLAKVNAPGDVGGDHAHPEAAPDQRARTFPPDRGRRSRASCPTTPARANAKTCAIAHIAAIGRTRTWRARLSIIPEASSETAWLFAASADANGDAVPVGRLDTIDVVVADPLERSPPATSGSDHEKTSSSTTIHRRGQSPSASFTNSRNSPVGSALLSAILLNQLATTVAQKPAHVVFFPAIRGVFINTFRPSVLLSHYILHIEVKRAH